MWPLFDYARSQISRTTTDQPQPFDGNILRTPTNHNPPMGIFWWRLPHLKFASVTTCAKRSGFVINSSNVLNTPAIHTAHHQEGNRTKQAFCGNKNLSFRLVGVVSQQPQPAVSSGDTTHYCVTYM
eukprot:200198-Prorocentrum_minimum.AAC.1